jgi:ComF family protein
MIPLAGARCQRCARPLDDGLDDCLSCRSDPPPFEAAVVWGEYDGALRTAILALKTRDRDEIAPMLGRRLAVTVASQTWFHRVDCVCAIPSHPARRLRRPWAAAEMIASASARCLRLPARRLVRRKGLWRQAGRSRAQRLRMPPNTFRADGSARGLRVLLLDDVITTGTTLKRASDALIDMRAEAVFCAALAIAPDSRRVS